MSCTFDPTVYAGAPIGMFHCPDCGEMVIAGLAHPETVDQQEYPEENRYGHNVCGGCGYTSCGGGRGCGHCSDCSGEICECHLM